MPHDPAEIAMELQNPPPSLSPVTKKQFWISAYLAALHRLPAKEAIDEADEALRLSDERWAKTQVVSDFRYTHDFELGHPF
jgi:ABC-type glutathione transport system ATPase component